MDVEQEASAARPGAHDAPDAVAAHDTIDTDEAHAAKAAATAAPKRPKSAEEIVRLVLDKAAAEEGAPQGGSEGGGSQKAAEAEGEEGAKAVVTFIHKSSQTQDRLKEACLAVGVEYKKIQNDVKTRWWSTYIMCESLIDLT